MAELLVIPSLLSILRGSVGNPTKNKQWVSDGSPLNTKLNTTKSVLSTQRNKFESVIRTCPVLNKKQRIHSPITVQAAGFQYIDDGNTACCQTCGLQVSDWTSDIKPFTIHSQRSPTCPYVLSILPTQNSIQSAQITLSSTTQEQLLITPKIDSTHVNNQPMTLTEADTLKQVRKRTFSHWPSRSSLSTAQMIEAGFFSCNVGDRVICIYCNIICQQWTPHTDNPSHLHKILSPKCPYVIAMLTHSPLSSISVINDQQSTSHMSTSSNNGIVCTAACNPAYIEIPKRYASFASWSAEKMPSIDDLVRAGFFFSGTNTIVTCFYCNGSLQNWGEHDNPMIEHARWFPQCAYAKQLCGNELYRKIQESKRAQQERTNRDNSNQGSVSNNNNSIGGRLLIQDESTLSRLVAARLDLSISQHLLNCNFNVSIIKRCWEDQLRLKQNDFVSDCDLLIACTILRKQIECINGKKENIIVPSVTMKKILEKEQANARDREQTVWNSLSTDSLDSNDVEMTTESKVSTLDNTSGKMEDKQEVNESAKKTISSQDEGNSSSSTNLCVLCLEEEKRLACVPCGHFATCVPCGHSLRSCPICRSTINGFVRIYL